VRAHRFEFSDINGHVVEFSLDQHGSRFIQQVRARGPAPPLRAFQLLWCSGRLVRLPALPAPH